MIQIVPVDMDNDGDLDLLGASSDDITWYENLLIDAEDIVPATTPPTSTSDDAANVTTSPSITPTNAPAVDEGTNPTVPSPTNPPAVDEGTNPTVPSPTNPPAGEEGTAPTDAEGTTPTPAPTGSGENVCF